MMNRRTFVSRGVALTAAAAIPAGLLGACSTEDDPSAPPDGVASVASPTTTAFPSPTEPAEPTGRPRHGGSIAAAFLGAGAAESLNPFVPGPALSFARHRAIHGVVGNLTGDPEDPFAGDLVESIEPSADLTEYTLRVRPGVRFTDGKPLTARDVAASLELAMTTGRGSFVRFMGEFDLAGGRVEDDHTLVLPTVAPIADGASILGIGMAFVVQEGTTEFTADMPTCGPFRVAEYVPGEGVRVVRNDDWWGGDIDGTYLDEVELRAIGQESARVNALRSGQVQFANDLEPVSASAIGPSDPFEIEESALPYVSGLSVVMNMAQPPFDDVRVRLAFKLAVNRQQILDTVLHGHGVLGNDRYSIGFPDYTELPQREHDPAEARRLLDEAGVSDLDITLTTGPETPGMIGTALLVAEQLSEIGVRCEVEQLPPGQLFADFERYTNSTLAGSYSSATPAGLYYAVSFTGGGPGSFGWHDAEVDRLVAQARGTADREQRQTLFDEVATRLHEDGNLIVPAHRTFINGRVPGLRGVRDGRYEQFPSFAFAWLDD